MTTFAVDSEKAKQLKDLEEHLRRAWAEYSSSLQGLKGSDYEDAELRSWDELQNRLKEIEDQRAGLVNPSGEAKS